MEQQIEQKSHAQRTAMLEKVISDERAERRNLVNETLEVNSQREETLDCLRRAQNEANVSFGNRHALDAISCHFKSEIILNHFKSLAILSSEMLVKASKGI